MDEFLNLLALGFTFGPNPDRLTIIYPDGTTQSGTRQIDRLRHLSGRMSNIAYMARAMDQYDGIQGTEGSTAGDKQFEHLFTIDEGGLALIYFALRRLQRAGEVDLLRHGLALLMAYEDGVISISDALSAIWKSDWEIPSSMKSLPAPALALAA